MATLNNGTASEIAKAAAQPNPANEPVKRVSEVDRVPMDLPELKLAVPDMPGYYLYWFLGKNTGKAQRAGYTFVDHDEVEITNVGIADDRSVSGSTDMGSRISVSAGATGEEDEERLYLMKLPIEWHQQDTAKKIANSESIAQQLRSGQLGSEGDPDRNKRYMKQGQDLFYPKGARR